MKTFVQVCLGLWLTVSAAFAQPTYDLRFVVVQNDLSTGGLFRMKVQIRAAGAPFQLGTSNLVFTYNTAALTLPVTGAARDVTGFTAHNFSGGTYQPMTVREPTLGRVSINIELTSPGTGTTVASTFMDVATLDFTISDAAQTTQLAWRTTSPNPTVVYADDEITRLSPGLLSGKDVAVPVELSSFTAEADGDRIILRWQTQSESENAGFYLYRSTEADRSYIRITQTLIPGAGNSARLNEYSFIDEQVTWGETYFYKLADVDFSGRQTFHGPVSITLGPVPEQYALEQNFPNPFNPFTTIRFSMPEAGHARLLIYDTGGRLVRTLINELRPRGNHSIVWDGRDDNGTPLPSGVYVYRFQSGKSILTRKLILAR